MKGYADFVRSLFVKRSDGIEGMLHASIGLAGEAGEMVDAVKKAWVYGQPLDRANVCEEAGDLLFYLVALCNLQGLTLDDIAEANRAKLARRYPSGYTDAAAKARADKA